MRNEILWIAFGTTLAFWLGCAGHSGEQNYKVLDDDRPMLQPARPTGGIEPVNEAAPNPQTAPTTAAATHNPDAGTPEAPFTETQPTTTTLDRSGWSVVRVTPVAGRTPHGPIYFETYYGCHDTRLIDRTTDPDELLTASLSGDAAGNLSLYNEFSFFIQPVWFAKDFGLFPIRVVQTPPWITETTP